MSQQNELVIIIRPSFKKICGPDACRAAIYNHLLYRLARKAKDEPDKKVRAGDVYWFASAQEICEDMDGAWCVNKVRKELENLVKAGLVGQRHNPAKGWDRKYQYFVGKEQGEKLQERAKAEGICLLHIGLNSEVIHLLHMVNAFTKYGVCICHKEELDLPNMVDAFTINGEAIPEGSYEGSTEESNKGNIPQAEMKPLTPNRTPPRPKVVPIKPQLTLEGQLVCGWYEGVRGRKLRLTDKNIVACNNLAEIDGVTQENLKAVIDYLDEHPFIKEKGLTVDPVNLAREDYGFSFEKMLQVVERTRKQARPTTNGTGKPKRSPEEQARYERFLAVQQRQPTGTGGR